MNIRKDDTVVVLSGKDKGKQGKVIAADPKALKVTVEGVNVASKHRKARSQKEEGGIIKMETPIYASKVMVVCPKCGKPTRVGHTVVDGKKTRACQVEGCGETETWPVDVIAHDWDTSAWITDGSKHWHKCKTPGCTAITDEAAHSGGTATCQAKAICAVCNQPYGEVADHDWDTSAWITDGSKHWHKCKTPGCTAITDEAAHSGGTATCQAKAKCAVCGEDYGEKSTENHAGGTKKVYYTEGDTGYEYYVVCLSCGEKTGETGVTPYDDETFDPSTVEWDYGEILVPGS